MPESEKTGGNLTTLIVLFVTWYVVSTAYSMFAKSGLSGSESPSPLVLSLYQFLAGVIGVILMERGSITGLQRTLQEGGPLLAVVALANFVGAYLTSAAMGAGSVAVAYIIKATEPLFAVALSYVLIGARYDRWTLATLIPLCCGLVMACWKSGSGDESSVISSGAALALFANVGMGMRNVLTKLRMELSREKLPMKEEDGEGGNNNGEKSEGPHLVFGAMSVYSLVYSLVLTVVDPLAMSQIGGFLLAGTSPAWRDIVIAGCCHAGYTLCSFAVLSQLTPAAHAISNSMKHVVVIGAASVFLGNSPSLLQGIGAGIAIIGVFLYNRAASQEKQRKKEAGITATPIAAPEYIRLIITSPYAVFGLASLTLSLVLTLVTWPASNQQIVL